MSTDSGERTTGGVRAGDGERADGGLPAGVPAGGDVRVEDGVRTDRVLAAILPPGQVVTEAAFTDPPYPPSPARTGPGEAPGPGTVRELATVLGLFSEEAELVARAVPKRQHEFATVRACARRALGRLDVPPAPLLRTKRGAPVWPDGVVGSMTHCAGFRAAAVARATDLVSLGIDAEPDGPLPEGVLDAIALPAEQTALRALAARRPGVCWDRLLFSAKESVFKTWYPLTGRELDFSEAEISIEAGAGSGAGTGAPADGGPGGAGAVAPTAGGTADTGTFTARLLVPGPVVNGARTDVFRGRWLARHGLVVTAIALVRVDADGAAGGAGGAGMVPGTRAGGAPTPVPESRR